MFNFLFGKKVEAPAPAAGHTHAASAVSVAPSSNLDSIARIKQAAENLEVRYDMHDKQATACYNKAAAAFKGGNKVAAKSFLKTMKLHEAERGRALQMKENLDVLSFKISSSQGNAEYVGATELALRTINQNLAAANVEAIDELKDTYDETMDNLSAVEDTITSFSPADNIDVSSDMDQLEALFGSGAANAAGAGSVAAPVAPVAQGPTGAELAAKMAEPVPTIPAPAFKAGQAVDMTALMDF